MRRVLVTGGAGFIGTAVVSALTEAGLEPVVLDSLRPDVHRDRTPPAGVVVGDVRDAELLDRLLPGTDAVVHLAAKVGLGVDIADMDDYVSSNDLGTAVLLRRCAAARGGALRPGQLHGRLRGGPLHLPHPWARATWSAKRRGVATPGVRAPVSRLRSRPHARTGHRGRAASTRATRMRRRRSRRSTSPGRGPGRPTGSRSRCGSTTSTDPGCRATPRTPAWPPDSSPASTAARRPRSSRTAASDGTSSTSRTSPGPSSAAVGYERPGHHAYNVGSGTVTTIGGMATALAEARGGPDPVVTGEFRLGDVRHITASSDLAREELGWSARVPLIGRRTVSACGGSRRSRRPAPAGAGHRTGSHRRRSRRRSSPRGPR